MKYGMTKRLERLEAMRPVPQESFYDLSALTNDELDRLTELFDKAKYQGWEALTTEEFSEIEAFFSKGSPIKSKNMAQRQSIRDEHREIRKSHQR